MPDSANGGRERGMKRMTATFGVTQHLNIECENKVAVSALAGCRLDLESYCVDE